MIQRAACPLRPRSPRNQTTTTQKSRPKSNSAAAEPTSPWSSSTSSRDSSRKRTIPDAFMREELSQRLGLSEARVQVSTTLMPLSEMNSETMLSLHKKCPLIFLEVTYYYQCPFQEPISLVVQVPLVPWSFTHCISIHDQVPINFPIHLTDPITATMGNFCWSIICWQIELEGNSLN